MSDSATQETLHPRILLLDDEERVVNGLSLHLRRDHEVHSATTGEEAVRLLRSCGPFAAVVSDLRMPGMDGAQFLALARQIDPDCVRILLTGVSDQAAAAAAVNDGQVFRFLTKPCAPQQVRAAIAAAVEQHGLLKAERHLLAGTLRGSVEVLVQVLEMVHPAAFGCATRIHDVVRQMCRKLRIRNAWQYEVAALLSQIGCVTLRPEVLERAYAGAPLTPAEALSFQAHPTVARDLVARIPRMDRIGEMIQRQLEAEPGELGPDPRAWDPSELGTQLLRIALDFDRLGRGEGSAARALEQMRRRPLQHHPSLLAALEGVRLRWEELVAGEVRASQLTVGMVLRQDVRSCTGNLIANEGSTITPPLLQRLRNFAEGVGIIEPIAVLMDRDAVARTAA